MSTIDNAIPSGEDLQELANKLFSALPGNSIPGRLPEISGKDTSVPLQFIDSSEGFNINSPRSSHPDPFIKGQDFIPESAAGNGVSPHGSDFVRKENFSGTNFNINNFGQTDFHGQVPRSLPGSGISPSAIEQGNSVNLQNPSTSFNSPQGTDFARKENIPGTNFNINNFGQTDFHGQVPRSLPVSGISPSAIEQGNSVNLQNPSTSFNSPHVSDFNSIPSYAGNDVFSPLASGNIIDSLPISDPLNFATSQHNPFGNPNPQNFIPQIRFPGQELNKNHFYFLEGKENYSQKDRTGLSGKEFTTASGIKGILSQHFDANFIRKDFPILRERVNGKPLIWFDNAATTQKPQQVIDRISYFYEHENSNIHRAAHELAARATDAYEEARRKIQFFLNAASINEIVFVRGTTEAINLVAKTYGEAALQAGDEIIISHLEHHANIVPWKQLADKKGLKIKVIPVDETGQILLGEYSKLLGPKTKLVAVSQVSNALGTITPIKEIIDMAHAVGAKVLVDGAQSVSHIRVDLKFLNPDFFVFSGHKIFGPTGIGVLYGKEELLNEMPPWQGGGNMIQDVTFDKIVYHKAPGRFEAGTGNIADAVGLGAAIDYVSKIGIEFIGQYEEFLLTYATKLLKDVPGIRLIGTAAHKASVVSFVLDGHTTEQVGSELNKEGIAVRSGHHCAQPILRRFGVETSVRPSLAFYNTCAEIDVLVATLHRLQSNRRFH